MTLQRRDMCFSWFGGDIPRGVQERIICMHGPITEQMSSLVTAQLLFLESEDPVKPINMYINRCERACALLALQGFRFSVATPSFVELGTDWSTG